MIRMEVRGYSVTRGTSIVMRSQYELALEPLKLSEFGHVIAARYLAVARPSHRAFTFCLQSPAVNTFRIIH